MAAGAVSKRKPAAWSAGFLFAYAEEKLRKRFFVSALVNTVFNRQDSLHLHRSLCKILLSTSLRRTIRIRPNPA
ncbi:exported hypothetical protein [Paraburkholderia piptadeniae]|uniref:Uncharacterized protein n=1 Tax=Paraburkholderia piptadeniae TaxID=1701573 RepID=A0A1N7S7N0_9BURK|nr:exported hypothetical protein [Paraburkholderia piptadeniae]